ncbi:uncharacterized protein [Amphiura filiformis]|uniref:uncharacterized protein n=1 Tax=Amphiura filiformis TaxID=82378 RepID=UPI003B21F8A4
MCASDISLGLINPLDGTLAWSIYPDINDLENAVFDLLNKNASNGNYGFCYLKCKQTKDKKDGSQLLLIPQYFTQNTCDGSTCDDAININVIWLDSTSHSHFFRSLPKSVKTLRNTKEKKLAHVFNYDLMQSMKGATLNNTIMFTLGNLKAKTGIGKIFNLFHNGGYYVTWIDDLCWTSMMKESRRSGLGRFFGINKEEKNTSKAWKNLLEKLKLKGVNQIALSTANCEILKSNGLLTPFQNEVAGKPICYNGKYHADYILSYLESLQKQLTTCKRPFFNYLDFNVGHDFSGLRIQTLDERLAKFINFLNNQSNTFTFMFGDHGLRYGKFLETAEGKVEMGHPVCFIHASKNLEEKLGKDKMESLRLNQDRLIDIVDLRQTLFTFSPDDDNSIFEIDKQYDTHPNGLFHPIDPKRSCSSLGIRLEGSKCICSSEGRTSHIMSNDTRVKVLADFALGEINNILQDQFVSANKESGSGFGSCERLVGKWIDNVMESYNHNIMVIEMNLHLPGKLPTPEKDEIFFVSVQVTSNSQDGPSLVLAHYERTSIYGVYDECCDEGVEGRLCICSPSNRSTTTRQWHLQPPVVFGTITTVVSLNQHVFIYERRSPYGVILEASCDQPNGAYEIVLLILNTLNIVSSATSHQQTTIIKYQRIFFLNAFYQLDPLQKWSLEYDVQFRQIF